VTDDRPVVAVTGASAGVGRATAIAFAREGFDVALLARGDAGLAAARHDVEAAGARALTVATDVADFHAVDAAATRVEHELGPVAVWVNNAMTTIFAPVDDVDPDDFRRAVEVTFLGQVWGTFAALARMRPRDRGTIVNVGSALAYVGIPLQSAYCASKFAVRGFSESVRAELLHTGSSVRLAMVHLPAVNTPQFDWCKTTLDRRPQPVPPIYQPEVAARAIVRSALDGKPARIVGSWNTLLVAASSVAPNVGNHYAAIAAWESQLADEEIGPGRPENLCGPADDRVDHGAHGSFDARAHGFFDPAFLRSLPQAATKFTRAVAASRREAIERLRERRSSRQ
jgi:NAD(P)-dependent dehydrogenase (short-subunit alcohol dehydrogenase family)